MQGYEYIFSLKKGKKMPEKAYFLKEIGKVLPELEFDNRFYENIEEHSQQILIVQGSHIDKEIEIFKQKFKRKINIISRRDIDFDKFKKALHEYYISLNNPPGFIEKYTISNTAKLAKLNNLLNINLREEKLQQILKEAGINAEITRNKIITNIFLNNEASIKLKDIMENTNIEEINKKLESFFLKINAVLFKM